jgi:hypothetical protein
MCAPQPTQVGVGNYPIQLTLEDGTKTQATFSGEPIIAYITLPDSTAFDSIGWHLGAGHYRHPDISPSMKIKKVQVELFWTTTPSCKDTVRKLFYDSVYVSLGGETKRSNRVTVYVTNVPPVVDSVKIGTTVDKIDDTIRFAISAADTTTHLSLRIGAHDINRDTLLYDWYSTRLNASLAPLPQILYDLPRFQFFDTITATVYDGKGGSAEKVVLLSKIVQNRPPSIDSLMINTVMYSGTDTSIYKYFASILDTVTFRVYASDLDMGDTVSISWTHTNTKRDIIHPIGTGTAMLWNGDLSVKTVLPRDSIRIVDTVVVVARDTRGDSARHVIQIIQGRVDHPPRIDSIRVDTAMVLKGSASLFVDSISVRDSVRIKPYFSDPDTDSVRWSYKVTRLSQYKSLPDSSIEYYAKDSLLSDTIVFTVKDELGDSAKKTLVLAATNRYPIIDSVAVGDTGLLGKSVVRAADTLFVRKDTLFVNDTVPFQLYAHDPDLGDTLSVQWTVSGGKKMLIRDVKGFFAAFPCTDTMPRDDTVRVTVRDKKQKTAAKAVVLHVKTQRRSHPPAIDSVRINAATVLKSGSSAYTDSVSGRDTLVFRVFASDPDSGDTVKWSARASRQSQLSVSADTVRYVCKDSLYKDTIVLTARDLGGDSARKMIVVSVVNRYPVIDSIVVRDTSGGTGSILRTTDTLYNVADTALSKDTFVIRVYAHDPDVGDTIAIAWSYAKLPVVNKDAKGFVVSYACADSLAYNDTLKVKVSDKKQKAVQREIVLHVKNVKRIVHTPPSLDSTWITDATKVSVKGTLAYTDSAISVRDTLLFRIFTSDVNKSDTVKVQGSAKFGAQLTKLADTLFQYICKDSLYTDSLVFVAKDLLLDSARKTIALKVTNRYPVVDSILVKDTLRLLDTIARVSDSVCIVNDSVNAKDTVNITLFAHDPDKAAGDSVVSIVWSAAVAAAPVPIDARGDKVNYVCSDQAYTETLTVRAADRKQKTVVQKIILNVRK